MTDRGRSARRSIPSSTSSARRSRTSSTCCASATRPQRLGNELWRGVEQLSRAGYDMPMQVREVLEDLRLGRLVLRTEDPGMPPRRRSPRAAPLLGPRRGRPRRGGRVPPTTTKSTSPWGPCFSSWRRSPGCCTWPATCAAASRSGDRPGAVLAVASPRASQPLAKPWRKNAMTKREEHERLDEREAEDHRRLNAGRRRPGCARCPRARPRRRGPGRCAPPRTPRPIARPAPAAAHAFTSLMFAPTFVLLGERERSERGRSRRTRKRARASFFGVDIVNGSLESWLEVWAAS